MKVLHVIPSLAAKEGGPSVAIHAVARAAAQDGVDVTVLSTTGSDDEQGAPIGLPFSDSGVTYLQFRRNITAYKVSWSATQWLHMNVHDFDVVHIHALFSYMSTAAGRVASRQQKPYIIRPLGVLNRWGLEHRRRIAKQLSLRLIELPLIRSSAALHFTSQAEADEAAQIGPTVAQARRAIIPLPIEIPERGHSEVFYQLVPAARGRDVVLFLSRVDPKKGLEVLIEAFARVWKANPHALLVIAGGGPEEYVASLRARCDAHRLSGHIVWTGHLGPAAKAAAFASAAVFVLPSASENFGVAVAEALAAGVPTIVSEGVAISSEIAASNAGIVVTQDAEQIARAVSLMLGDRRGACALAAAGMQLVQQRYSTAAVRQQLRELYDAVVRENPRSRSA